MSLIVYVEMLIKYTSYKCFACFTNSSICQTRDNVHNLLICKTNMYERLINLCIEFCVLYYIVHEMT